MADSEETWDMVRKLKQTQKRRGRQQTDLTNAEARKFINYWQGLFQEYDKPELWHDEQTQIKSVPTRDEIEMAIRELPNKKAPGPDGIAAELLKQGGKAAIEMTVSLVQHIWTTLHVPEQLSKALICLIPKKQGSRDPQDHRPISLMNTWLKVIDRLLTKRLRKHLEETQTLSDEQAGFRKERGCSE